MDLSSRLVKDYDRVRNELVIELNDLKSFILKIFTQLDSILEMRNDSDANEFENVLFCFSFDEVFKELDSMISNKIDFLKSKIIDK